MNKQFINILLHKSLINEQSASKYFCTSVSEQVYFAVIRRKKHKNYGVYLHNTQVIYDDEIIMKIVAITHLQDKQH